MANQRFNLPAAEARAVMITYEKGEKMLSLRKYKLGGKLLATGASLALLFKIYYVALPNENVSMTYKFVGQIFGSWLALLVSPPVIDGTTLDFTWTSLLWLPWAAVFIAFLLWVAVKVIKGQFKSDLVPLPVLGILGFWFFAGLFYERILNGFDFFKLDLKWLLPMLLSDLATIGIIVGIGLILFSYKTVITGTADEVPLSKEMVWSHILFSFEGRINRANFWLYQVLILNIIFIACIAIGAALGKDDGIIAGYAIGVLVILWPSLAIAVKRCHDRNRSGAFILVSLIPIVSLWYAVEVLFLQGTEGDNKYGPDPLMQQITDRKEEQTTHTT